MYQAIGLPSSLHNETDVQCYLASLIDTNNFDYEQLRTFS